MHLDAEASLPQQPESPWSVATIAHGELAVAVQALSGTPLKMEIVRSARTSLRNETMEEGYQFGKNYINPAARAATGARS